jgi:predicted transcriptional regulator
MNKTRPSLGSTEMDILQEIWDLGPSTVPQVHDRIAAKRKVAYTTIMTIMQNLAKKGYLTVDKSERTHVYSAKANPMDVRKTLLANLMDKMFHGSPAALVRTLAETESLSDEDRRLLEDLISKLD